MAAAVAEASNRPLQGIAKGCLSAEPWGLGGPGRATRSAVYARMWLGVAGPCVCGLVGTETVFFQWKDPGWGTRSDGSARRDLLRGGFFSSVWLPLIVLMFEGF